MFLLFTFVRVRRLAHLDRLHGGRRARRCCSPSSRSWSAPLVLLPVLARAGIATRDRRLIAWFGPRGLELAAAGPAAGVRRHAGRERLFAITCLVVLLSVLLHGAGIAFYLRRLAHDASLPGTPSAPAHAPTPSASPVSRPTDPRPMEARPAEARPAARPTEARPSDGPAADARASDARPEADLPERITIEEVRRMREEGTPVLVLDVRTERSYRDDPKRAAGSLRLPARGCRPPRPGATTRQGCDTRSLLYLKGRSDKHPCGARASSGRMEEGPRTGRRLDGVAGGGLAGGGEVGRTAGRGTWDARRRTAGGIRT